MTLLITVFAAVISTVLWYKNDLDGGMKLGTLSLMYWGASIMWFIDAVFEHIQSKAEPAFEDMINDLYLGLSVTALGLVIWLIILFIKDPKGIVRNALNRK